MKAKFRKVSSAVCGAASNRVFRKFEIGAMLKNRRVRSINNRPVGLFKDFYKLRPDEAFRLFCITELLDARKRAKKVGTAETWADYRERRRFFIVGQEELLRDASMMLPAEKAMLKLEKRRLLTTYALVALSAPALPKASASSRRMRTVGVGHGSK